GPRPSSASLLSRTDWISWNSSRPESKNLDSFTVKPAMLPPTPAAPPRGPGSVGLVCAKAVGRQTTTANATLMIAPALVLNGRRSSRDIGGLLSVGGVATEPGRCVS